MKRTIALLLAVLVCLSLAACSQAPASEQSPQSHTESAGTERFDGSQPQSGSSAPAGSSAENAEGAALQPVDLAGPWHLDGEQNDLAAFAADLERFPGYGEWGAGMEIRSDGRMSWYIGAAGGSGTYTVEDEWLHASLVNALDQTDMAMDFRIRVENETPVLEMDYQNLTICWAYGDREEVSAKGMASRVYVDRQGTDAVYSSLSFAQSDSGYEVEMEIYRLGYFRGTAAEADGMLVYTDDRAGITGTIQCDSGRAVFRVTESASDLAKAGTIWIFPELQEG